MKTIKNKLGFAATAPNIIITNSFFYGLIDLYQRQLEEKITSFMVQINNPGLLGTITNLRLNNIQHALSLPRSPLFGLTTDDFTQYRRFKTQKQLMKRVKKSHLVNLIFLLQEHELSISESPPQIPSRDDNMSISFNFERGTNNNTLKPVFAAIDDHDQVSFHAFKRLLPSNQSLATTNHLIPDLTTPSNSLTEFDFCPGCDRDISVTRDSRYTRCSDRFATNDIIPIPNSVTVWNHSSKHNVDSRSYANNSMENILQYLRRLHDLKGTYTPSDLIQIYFNDNSTRSRLLEISSQLRDSKQVNYTAYTDGSLQHLGSNDITMTYGFILIDDASNEIRFKSSISHWPSSTRAEIMAVVTTLLVLPRNSHITIHTDSQATIDGFHSHITTIVNFLPRLYFTWNSNNFLWLLLYNIVNNNNISVNFVKVKGHSGDHYNEQVDDYIRIDDSIDQLSFTYNNLSLIKYNISWKAILIEENLRRFIRKINYITNTESFINLNRNGKYRHLSVDWQLTFMIIQGCDRTYVTSYKQSVMKHKKIRYIIEELPTVEKMKTINNVIFKDWKCALCETDDETFDHVWLCDEQEDSITILIAKCKEYLLLLINKYRANKDTVYTNLDNIISDDIWKCIYDNDALTLLDLIKGIIPASFNNINTHLQNHNNFRKVIFEFRSFLLAESEKIWTYRCMMQHEKERINGISSQDKNNRIVNNSYIDIHRKIDNSNQFCLEALESRVKLGSNVLSYYGMDLLPN
ncbi:hypothetical protein RclHR1_01420001 [Rhizophagus clarus]|uniref:RNase H type-1 domain-containing protein n=1 Tax=Rhizophagus clarus TaxID=94130 RepID=A0A2Z6R4N4_9GLOM|nr:hypothetical protein RclHR1_01420001 [Rhizophagus clarus]